MKKTTSLILLTTLSFILPLYLSSSLCFISNLFDYELDDVQPLKVMTYNIRGARSIDGHVDLSTIISQIKSMDPDIIAFQEIDYRLPRTQFQNQAKLLGNELEMNYVFIPNINFVIGSYGSAIFSKFPITAFEYTTLPSRLEKRGVLRAQIRTKSQSIDVYATHLGLNYHERIEQINSLTAMMSKTTGPKILLGDFNAKPTETTMELIRSQYIDPVFEQQLHVTTYKHHDKDVQIDYIFHSPNFIFENVFSEASLISDHNPLMYSLILHSPME